MATTLRPPPKFSVSEWADENRRLSPEASSEPGRWLTSRAEYQRGMMDAVSDPSVEQVVIMTGSQVGKTELLNNVVGFHIDQDPAPILVVQPTLEMAATWSSDRLGPMLRDTPALNGKVADPRTRDSGSTKLHKVFAGGHLTACGANSAASLASRPIRIVLCDEVDRYPASAGSEGDPVSLARKRAATFWNRKIILVSTPTIKNVSRIEQAYAESDQREYHVPCRHCGHEQVLKWASVQWTEDRPDTAVYVCEDCGAAWDDADRLRAIRRGVWRAQAEFKGVAGFRLSGLYSPWTPLADAVRDFLEARKQPATLRVWVNTYLGETWEDQGESVDEIGIMTRREDYEGCPNGVVLITAGVDVQDDRLEVEIVGWGRDEETWSLDYRTLHGDPSAPQIWADLDAVLSETWRHPKGFDLPVRASCIDSGGHHTQAVYNFVRPREGRRIFAVKGVGGEGKPIVARPTKNNIGRIKLFPVGVDTAKELVFSRLRINEAGPGYCHFPLHYDAEYFRQLTAEQLVTRYHKGFQRREWRKVRPRNEALDCRVYAVAAYGLLNANINAVASKVEARANEMNEIEPAEMRVEPLKQIVAQRPVRRKPSGGWVNGWR